MVSVIVEEGAGWGEGQGGEGDTVYMFVGHLCPGVRELVKTIPSGVMLGD